MNWCILAPLAVQWLREGQPLGGVSGVGAPGTPGRLAASQAVGGFNRYREGSFWSETLQRLTAVSPDRILAKRRQNCSLLRTSRRQLEGKGRTGWSPSTELSSSTGAFQHINSFPGLAHLAGLEMITCKRSSFTTVAVHCSSVLQSWALPGLLPGTQRRLQLIPRELGCLLPALQNNNKTAFEEDAVGECAL